MWVKSLLFVLLAFVALSCTDAKKPSKLKKKKLIPKTTINSTMVNTLKGIAQSAKPMENYHLNSQRADFYLQKSIEAKANSNEQAQLRTFYFWELLYAGQTQKCIEELQLEIQKLNFDINSMDKVSKSYFDLLALAHLRLGERENCLSNHSAQSCIVPIQTDGWHTIKSGSEKAIKIYTKILQTFPEDYESKWLYNLAHMTLGLYPHAVPKEFLIEEIKTNSSGFQFNDVAMRSGVAVKGLSGGCCVEDFDNDGFLDIVASAYGYEEQIRIFKNQGNGNFKDVTESSELKGLTGGLNMIHADYNNDGLTDILVLRGAWLGRSGKHPNSLLKNLGKNKFEDVTKKAGIFSLHPTQTATWADFNNDGYLDLFIGNESSSKAEPHPCELYINNQNETFTNVTKQAFVQQISFVKSVVSSDINNDGYPDLYLSVLGGNNVLYLNQPQNDGSIKFKNITTLAKLEEPIFSFSTLFFDYNNDGWQDLLVMGYDLIHQTKVAQEYALELSGKSFNSQTPILFKNDGKGGFEDVTSQVGLNVVSFGMGVNSGDFDNDGYQDILIGTGTPDFRSQIPNRAFKNIDGKYFKEVTYQYGLGNIQKGHGIAFGDFDQDGDQDIYAVLGGAFEGDDYFNSLYQNNLVNDNNWITIKLEGTTSNKSAIGARIKINVIETTGKKRTIERVVCTGGSFGASSLQQEIGLGNIGKIQSLKITWPNKDQTEQTFKNLPLNSQVKITEGKTEFETIINRPFVFKEKANHNHHQH